MRGYSSWGESNGRGEVEWNGGWELRGRVSRLSMSAGVSRLDEEQEVAWLCDDRWRNGLRTMEISIIGVTPGLMWLYVVLYELNLSICL